MSGWQTCATAKPTSRSACGFCMPLWVNVVRATDSISTAARFAQRRLVSLTQKKPLHRPEDLGDRLAPVAKDPFQRSAHEQRPHCGAEGSEG